MFALMDTDRDGKVTYEELKTGLRKVGSQLAEPEIKMLMEVVNFFACISADLKVTSVVLREKNYHVCFTPRHTSNSRLDFFLSNLCPHVTTHKTFLMPFSLYRNSKLAPPYVFCEVKML